MKLSFREQTASKTNVANIMVSIMSKSFLNLSKDILTTLEYANQAWDPYLLKDEVVIRNKQRRATKLFPVIRIFNYSNRFMILKFLIFEFRRKRGKIIENKKILKEIYSVAATE